MELLQNLILFCCTSCYTDKRFVLFDNTQYIVPLFEIYSSIRLFVCLIRKKNCIKNILLSRGRAVIPLTGLTTPHFLCLSQARSLISNVTCRGLIVFSDLGWEVIVRFVDICVIVDHQFNSFPVWLCASISLNPLVLIIIIILYLHNTPMWVKQIQVQTSKT